MPITTSAKKALRQSIRRREKNMVRKEALKSAIKSFEKLLKTNKASEAKILFPKVQKTIDKAAKVGLIKANNATRKKSRLARALAKVSAK